MRKIVLISLALLSQKVFAEGVELQCKEKGHETFTAFLQIGKDRGDGLTVDATRYRVDFEENSKAKSFSEDSYAAFWGDTEIEIRYGHGDVTHGFVSRETLEYHDASNPIMGYKDYSCELTDGLEPNAKQWKKEAKAYEETLKEADKAKNVI